MTISVIVPVYNVEAYLDECLTSLLSQTEAFDEIIIINDGSTDKSKEICEKYYNQFSNILFINQENQGLAISRNIGLIKASGDYVIFVDSDDYMQKETSSVLKKVVKEREIEVLFYNAEIQYDISSKERKNAFNHSDIINGANMTGMEYFKQAFPQNYTVSSCVAIYRRSFLQKYNILFPEGIYYEDNFFNLQVITNAKIVSGIDNVLYTRRCREDSIMTGALNEKKCRDLVKSQTMLWKYLGDNLNWAGQEEVLKRFIAHGLIHTIFALSQSDRKDLVDKLKDELIRIFFDLWTAIFLKEGNEWGVDLALLLAFEEFLKDEYVQKNTILACKNKRINVRSEDELLRKKVRKQIIERIRLFPFDNKNMKIGIYGIGKHTLAFFEFYQKEIGEILANIFFVISEKKDNYLFAGKPIYSFEEIPDNTDYIFISSYIYQQEMYDNLCKKGFNEDKILRIYKETDICDLIMMNWIVKR